MTILELLSLIWENLRRMKFRVALTAAGVLIGTLAIILLVSIGNGLQNMATSSFGSVGELSQIQVFNFNFDETSTAPTITEAKLDEWRTLDNVTAVTPVISISAPNELKLNRYLGSAQISGIDGSQIENLGLDVQSGNLRLVDGTIVIGSEVGQFFFNERTFEPLDEPLDLQGKTLQLIVTKFNRDGSSSERRVRLRVTGVLAPSGGQNDNTIYMTLSEVQTINQWATGVRFNPRRDGYNNVLIQVSEPNAVTPVETIIQEEGYQTFSAQSILSQLGVFFAGLQITFGCLGGIALVVAAIGIANTMIMAIYERTREIGLMKAVGATNRDVMLIFLGESGAIGLLGGIMGAILGTGVGQIAGLIAQNYLQAQLDAPSDLPPPINTPAWLIIFALIFSLLVGILSGLYPALRATRLDPMTALKYE